MESIVLSRSELSALLEETGIDQLPGVGADQMPQADAMERQQGLSRLEERKLVKIGGDEVIPFLGLRMFLRWGLLGG